MRIVAGKYRHRIIEMTNLETTRETQDKVRMAIYNMIGPYFDGGVCLDLFAGSGAMGIEALSRGMDYLYLNDLNKDALNVCKKNCTSLGIKEVKYYNLDYKAFYNTVDIKYDLIILDPPYKMVNVEEILELSLNKLNNDGLIVFEMGIDTKFPEEINGLSLIKNKTYGIKRVVVYRSNHE